MGPSNLRRVQGYLAVVQEQRFRLLTDSGQALLLTLSVRAYASPEDLYRWHCSHVHVAVDYLGEPNTADAEAWSVAPLPS